MPTLDNLKAAFAGESQANRKYLAFARKAEADGRPGIAKLFRAAAEAETVHAHADLRVMGGIGDTLKNLDEALAGEGHEFREMYPGFVAEADREGNRAAATIFRHALAVEKIHHGLYGEARAALAAGKDLPVGPIHVCTVCGNTVLGAAQDKCSVCGAPKDKFVSVA